MASVQILLLDFSVFKNTMKKYKIKT